MKKVRMYPPDEDIYEAAELEANTDPEDPAKLKQAIPEDLPESELDVPGSDLDDAQEELGSEDEENNYYSIGGDGHNDLEEDIS